MAKEDKFDVAVIGAGPAGMMAAGTAAESGAKVILIEKNKQLGKKLLLTGNSKCNITNAEFNLRKLAENYNKDGKFLFHAFFVFGPKKVIDFFERLKVKIKIEKNNKVFPASEKATDVLDALKRYLLKNKVDISLNSQVLKVILKENRIEKIALKDREIIAKKYIFCTGGKSYPITGSTGEGFKWASDLGHSVSELSPGLTPIKVKESWAKNLQGLSLKDIKISILQNNKTYLKEMGDILFTHFGLSGPAILNVSAEVGYLLKKGEVKICFDLFPLQNQENIGKELEEIFKRHPKKTVKNALSYFLPEKLAEVLPNIAGIEKNRTANNMSKTEKKSIAKTLKNFGVTATGLFGFDSAMITKGGVSLKEIDDKTMRSKIIDNLFFAGEIINIDGKTGGFNLQACWSAGYLAGKSATNQNMI